MIEHIPELIDAGIDSFKIEGRMKTALYVATVARTYRKAIDDYQKDPELYKKNMLGIWIRFQTVLIVSLRLDFSLENQIMRRRFMTITHISGSILILELSGLLRMGLQELNSAISFL